MEKNGAMVMCSIFDVKAEAWHQPLFFQTEGQAIRAFGDTVNTPESDFLRHAEDYTMFAIGWFDIRTGEVIPMNSAVPLMKAVNCLNNPREVLE